jgi:hypothetical protein
MNPMITLSLIPFASSRQEMVVVLWLETSTLNELTTIEPMSPIRVALLAKNRLDIMISLIVGTLDPDPLRLVYCWNSHKFPSCTILV